MKNSIDNIGKIMLTNVFAGLTYTTLKTIAGDLDTKLFSEEEGLMISKEHLLAFAMSFMISQDPEFVVLCNLYGVDQNSSIWQDFVLKDEANIRTITSGELKTLSFKINCLIDKIIS